MSRQTVQIISFIAFVATLTVAIFGFSIMGTTGNMVMGCFGAVPGGNCSVLGTVQHFESHVNTFRSITSVLVGSIFSILALLLIALLSLIGLDTDSDLRHRFTVWHFYDSIVSYFVRLNRWLALHEKRDPSFVYAVNR
ncbi:hypothetical protein M1295_03380 [Patescibacteria group bacterium]|nr:hypothetical protein [Patescibacteria group bacterium]